MGQYTMTPIKGDRRLIAAIKAVGADEMKTIGEVVRIAIDTVYGPQIAAKLKGFAETGDSIMNCPVCGRPLAGYVQPAYANTPARRYETCWTEGCDLYAVTLESGEHQKLSPERVTEYAAVNRRIRNSS